MDVCIDKNDMPVKGSFNHSRWSYIPYLVGGFAVSTHLKKHAGQLGSFPQVEWNKAYLKPSPRYQFTINDHHQSFIKTEINAERYVFWNLQYHPFQFPRLLQPVPIPCRWAASRWETCCWNVKTNRLFGKRWLIDSDIYLNFPRCSMYWRLLNNLLKLGHFTISWPIGCNMS